MFAPLRFRRFNTTRSYEEPSALRGWKQSTFTQKFGVHSQSNFAINSYRQRSPKWTITDISHKLAPNSLTLKRISRIQYVFNYLFLPLIMKVINLTTITVGIGWVPWTQVDNPSTTYGRHWNVIRRTLKQSQYVFCWLRRHIDFLWFRFLLHNHFDGFIAKHNNTMKKCSASSKLTLRNARSLFQCNSCILFRTGLNGIYLS